MLMRVTDLGTKKEGAVWVPKGPGLSQKNQVSHSDLDDSASSVAPQLQVLALPSTASVRRVPVMEITQLSPFSELCLGFARDLPTICFWFLCPFSSFNRHSIPEDID